MLLCDWWRPWKEKQSWPTRINKVTWTLTVGNEDFNFLRCFQIKLLCEVWRAKYSPSTVTLRIAASLPFILQKILFYPDLRTVSLCKSGWLSLLHTSSAFARIGLFWKLRRNNQNRAGSPGSVWYHSIIFSSNQPAVGCKEKCVWLRLCSNKEPNMNSKHVNMHTFTVVTWVCVRVCSFTCYCVPIAFFYQS